MPFRQWSLRWSQNIGCCVLPRSRPTWLWNWSSCEHGVNLKLSSVAQFWRGIVPPCSPWKACQCKNLHVGLKLKSARKSKKKTLTVASGCAVVTVVPELPNGLNEILSAKLPSTWRKCDAWSTQCDVQQSVNDTCGHLQLESYIDKWNIYIYILYILFFLFTDLSDYGKISVSKRVYVYIYIYTHSNRYTHVWNITHQGRA